MLLIATVPEEDLQQKGLQGHEYLRLVPLAVASKVRTVFSRQRERNMRHRERWEEK